MAGEQASCRIGEHMGDKAGDEKKEAAILKVVVSQGMVWPCLWVAHKGKD